MNHMRSAKNPYSQSKDVSSLEDIIRSPTIHHPVTKLQCCPTSDGAGAAVVASQRFLDARPQLQEQAVLIAGQALRTDSPRLYCRSAMELVGFDMSRLAALDVYAQAGISPGRSRRASCTTALARASYASSTRSARARRARRTSSSAEAASRTAATS